MIGREEIAGGLAGALGANRVLVDREATRSYVVDWTGRYEGTTPAVVRPQSTDEVAATLRWCSEHRVPVVPQGGNTGLVGGSVPRAGEVVVSLRALDRVGPVDVTAAQVTAGAGATLASVRDRARPHELDVGVDLSARDSATIGGMVATNAGGVHVIRHGPMRHQVVGVEAVLADGRVLRSLRGLTKDNTGYDLAGLLTGSEGTLAVVTAVQLRLVTRRPHRVAALLGCDSFATAVGVATRLRRVLPSLEALEVMFADGVGLVAETFDVGVPFGAVPPVVLLVEVAGAQDPSEELANALSPPDETFETAVATDSASRDRLWRLRDLHTEAIATLGVPHKLDVTLPVARLVEFERHVRAVVGRLAPAARCVLFGHLGDGNLHVNVIGPARDDDRVDEAVFELVAAMDGSISAEHGIGVAKRELLPQNRSAEELAVFRALKDALDPAGILNPGVLLPAR